MLKKRVKKRLTEAKKHFILCAQWQNSCTTMPHHPVTETRSYIHVLIAFSRKPGILKKKN